MNESIRQALRYVKNTGGGATKANFVEDHAPVGEMLWSSIATLVVEDDTGRIWLTAEGERALKE